MFDFMKKEKANTDRVAPVDGHLPGHGVPKARRTGFFTRLARVCIYLLLLVVIAGLTFQVVAGE